MKRTSRKNSDEIIRLECSSIRSMFHIYRLKNDDLKLLSSAIRRIINDYYLKSPQVICGLCEKKLSKTAVSKKTVKDIEKHILKKNSVSKKLIGRAIIFDSGGKISSFQNYVCGYIAEKVMADYSLPYDVRRNLKKELANSNMKSDELDKVTARINADSDDTLRIENIHRNEHYKALFGYLEKQVHSAEESQRITDMNAGLILKEMPANIIDMYPSARSIKRKFIIHLGPTNSGKTYSALLAFKNAVRGIYLAPLRLLAYEVFEQVNAEGLPCTMTTGEETIDVPFSKHISATVEMADVNTYYDVAVIDECQMIADRQRGGAWTEAILGTAADEIHLCASENALKMLTDLIELCGDSYSIEYHQRHVPLLPEEEPFIFPQSVRKNDALIVFSKSSVLSYSRRLREQGINASVIYGDLPYDVRRNEVSRFVNGETDVVVSTDAIGMGLNLPVERVVFLEHEKFDGRRKREITPDEAAQIAGRAGRLGKFSAGFYASAADPEGIIKKVTGKKKNIHKARLRFPKNIIKVEMPLSSIMGSWSRIPYNREMFSPVDIKREIKLCRYAEKYTDNKPLIFEFATMPFNENKLPIMELWQALLMKELDPEKADDKINELLSFSEESELSELELLYRKYDLMYYYCTRFHRGQAAEIIGIKHRISQLIMRRLESGCTEKKAAFVS